MTLEPRAAVAVLAVILAGVLSACSRPLPEEGSPQAILYAARCGGCHAPYAPGSMVPAMWKLQVDRMDQKYRAAGLPIPSGPERDQILDYLVRNAGG